MGANKPQLPNSFRETPVERLGSWKEIAAYLKRDERTVRRWEKEGLPVHRHLHKKQASVYAYKAEIEAWWNDERQKLEENEPDSPRRPLLSRTPVVLATAGLAVFAALGAGGLRGRFHSAPTVPAIRSLAVLPLENLSGDPAQDYFADGVTEELTTELAQVPALRVISRVSAMQYRAKHKGAPEIASELHVDALVEGSVVRSGDHVRITAQLIEAKDDRHLWAQSFEGELRDLLVMQDEVAGKIAGQIRLRLPLREELRGAQARAINPEAHDLYMHGVAFRDNNDEISVDKSIEWFHRSLEKDPITRPRTPDWLWPIHFRVTWAYFQRRKRSRKPKRKRGKRLGLILHWARRTTRWHGWPMYTNGIGRLLNGSCGERWS